jgi:hypothetical protein
MRPRRSSIAVLGLEKWIFGVTPSGHVARASASASASGSPAGRQRWVQEIPDHGTADAPAHLERIAEGERAIVVLDRLRARSHAVHELGLHLELDGGDAPNGRVLGVQDRVLTGVTGQADAEIPRTSADPCQ